MSYSIGIDARILNRESGGIARYNRNLLTELLKLDTQNHYTALINTEDLAELSSLKAANFRILPIDIPQNSLAEQRKLPRILAAEKFDLVHFTHFVHPILYRKPFVVTV